jgi:hypothetical protein
MEVRESMMDVQEEDARDPVGRWWHLKRKIVLEVVRRM